MKTLLHSVVIALVLALTGCVTASPKADDKAFRELKPESILVLPPLNLSMEPDASAAVLAQATYPLAESGYYVVPVGVMEETFRQNGMTTPDDIHAIPGAKLREIFGADTALYMTVNDYGSSYRVVTSATIVDIDAVLIDLRTGTKLWSGSKSLVRAAGTEGNLGNGTAGLVAMLVHAVVDQVVSTVTDRSYSLAGEADNQLLSAGGANSIKYGPYSPHYPTQK